VESETQYTFSKFELRTIRLALEKFYETALHAESIVNAHDNSRWTGHVNIQLSSDVKRALERVTKALQKEEE
jgi:hypothetical protein